VIAPSWSEAATISEPGTISPNDDIPTYVVIPVLDHLDLTRALIGQLVEQEGHEALLVFDNGSTDGTTEWLHEQAERGVLEAVDAAGMTIHQMWNRGARIATARHPTCNVAILNNDLAIGPDFCHRLAGALRSHPSLWAVSPRYDDRAIEGVEYVSSTFKNGGLAGFAFMVRGEIFSRIDFDEELEWWYGDDDLVAQVEASGHRVGITGATTVEHVNGGSQTISYTQDKLLALEHDVLHMYGKWGHT
jgi:GT2 family glycosyltransferase